MQNLTPPKSESLMQNPKPKARSPIQPVLKTHKPQADPVVSLEIAQKSWSLQLVVYYITVLQL